MAEYPTEEGRGGAAFRRQQEQYERLHPDSDSSSDSTTDTTTHTTRRTAVADDPFTAYQRGSSNTAQDQAVAIIENFMSIMGWPAGVDTVQLALRLLQLGLETSPEQAYNWLYTQLSSTLQKANPNAEFGLAKDAYVQQVNALKDSWENYTGGADIPADVVRMAIDQGWTQTELLDFLQKDKRFSDPAKMPWLHQGMGYRDVKNQFYQIYGKNPTSPDQLASWWSFRVSAAPVSGSTASVLQAGQGPNRNLPSQSEIR